MRKAPAWGKDRPASSRRKFLKDAMAASVGLAIRNGVTLLPAAETSTATTESEWTFEQARKLWKPMTRAVQHIGIPGCQWQAGVMWDGALVFGPLSEFRENPGVRAELAVLEGSPGMAGQPANPKFSNLLHVSIGYGSGFKFLDRRGTGNPSIRRRLESGRLPIPHVETVDGDLIWEETVFAHLLGRPLKDGMDPKPGDMPIVHLLFKVRNTGGQEGVGHLWLHFADASQVRFGYKCAQGDELGPALEHRFEPPLGILQGRVRYVIPKPAKGNLTWHEEGPTPEGMKNPAKKVIEWQVPLVAGEEAQLRVVFPYGLLDSHTGSELVDLRSDKMFAEARDFWQEVVGGQVGTISTPDSFVNDYLAAVVGQMAEQIGYRHQARVWMYKTSPNWYEGYWPCNAAKALPTLDLRGLARYSRPVLKSFIDTQTADIGDLTHERREGMGKTVSGEGYEKSFGFLGNFGVWTANTLLISHGLELWALASHYRITRDRQWLGDGPGSPLHAILSACDWIAVQRRRTMREENTRKVAHWGLLPAASAHDWLSGNAIFNDAECIFGMIEAVRLLREIDHPRTEKLALELNDYRTCLRDRYREARDKARRVPLPDGRDIPYVPRDVYELDWAKVDWTYSGYSPVRAGAYGALDPHDELVDQALEYLEAGMPRGEGYYFDSPGSYLDKFGHPTAAQNFMEVSDQQAPRHFLWRHYVEYETMWPIGFDLFLQRDDLPRFFEWLFNNLAMVIHHDFRVGVESLDGVPSNAPGEGERWRAIRDMFVNERGGYDGTQQSLWLLQAIPRCWLRQDSPLSAKRMGTHFGGQVDLEARMANDGNSLEVKTSLDLAVAPTEIRMRLRSGDGRALASATINGSVTPVLEKDTIRLPGKIMGDYHIVGRFS